MPEQLTTSNPIQKDDLENLVEPFVVDLLTASSYDIDLVAPERLLTWNRLDLAFKLLFLELKERHPKLALQIYREDIRCQTLGTFTEHENETKNTFEKYVSTFEKIERSIRGGGFNPRKSLVPLSGTGSIFNGAHRVASAIKENVPTYCLRTELPIHVCDYRFYQRHGVAAELIEMAVRKHIEYANNIYIGFLWPSGIGNAKKSEETIPNVVYRKTISLSLNGKRNLLFELYKHMDWIGTKKDGFSGIDTKLVECFSNQSDITVVAFQSESIDAVRQIKEQVRRIHDIGFSSIHITDTKDEARRISELIFNENGLHFLDHAKWHKYDTEQRIEEFGELLHATRTNPSDVVVDGSFILALYGLRDAHDVDFLSSQEVDCSNSDFEAHDDQLGYHGVEKIDLLFDPRYSFVYSGLKFVSFKQLRRMKMNRDEAKDRHDAAAMTRLLESPSMKHIIGRIIQRMFFFQLRARATIRKYLVLSFKKVGLYDSARRLYWSLMR